MKKSQGEYNLKCIVGMINSSPGLINVEVVFSDSNESKESSKKRASVASPQSTSASNCIVVMYHLNSALYQGTQH
jgi:hypothetical protein